MTKVYQDPVFFFRCFLGTLTCMLTLLVSEFWFAGRVFTPDTRILYYLYGAYLPVVGWMAVTARQTVCFEYDGLRLIYQIKDRLWTDVTGASFFPLEELSFKQGLVLTFKDGAEVQLSPWLARDARDHFIRIADFIPQDKAAPGLRQTMESSIAPYPFLGGVVSSVVLIVFMTRECHLHPGKGMLYSLTQLILIPVIMTLVSKIQGRISAKLAGTV